MRAEGIQTRVVRLRDDLFSILIESIESLEEKSVVVITSKIISLCEGAVADTNTDLPELIAKDAEWYTDANASRYKLQLTIKHKQLSLNAGIDRSNSDGQITLLPRDPQKTANELWEKLREHYGISHLGIILIDSVPFPLKWGHTARSLAYCGFRGLSIHIGEEDIFGRKMEMTKMSMVEGIAAAAHLEMGEAAQRRPIAVVTQVRDLEFQDHAPTQQDLDELNISREDDAFAPLLLSKLWRKGGAT